MKQKQKVHVLEEGIRSPEFILRDPELSMAQHMMEKSLSMRTFSPIHYKDLLKQNFFYYKTLQKEDC